MRGAFCSSPGGASAMSFGATYISFYLTRGKSNRALEPLLVLEEEEHKEEAADDETNNDPEIERPTVNGIVRAFECDDIDEEGEGKRKERHDRKYFQRFVLLGREEGVVGLAELVEGIGRAHNVIVPAVVFAREFAQKRGEDFAEKFMAFFFERSQDFAMRLNRLPEI